LPDHEPGLTVLPLLQYPTSSLTTPPLCTTSTVPPCVKVQNSTLLMLETFQSLPTSLYTFSKKTHAFLYYFLLFIYDTCLRDRKAWLILASFIVFNFA
jgi:hypothetical protein